MTPSTPQTPGSDDGSQRPLPSAEELNAASLDGSGDQAVSSQPFDSDPADLEEARERVTWDADTDQG